MMMRAPHTATGSAKEANWRRLRQCAWHRDVSRTKGASEAPQPLLDRGLRRPSAFFDPDQRPADVDDADLISNPYLLYELHRLTDDPISGMTIDRGMLPDRVILEAHPLPEPSRLEDKIDPRRVRALLVAALEQGAEQGHTLLPRSWLRASIDKMPLETDCPVGPEVIAGLGDFLVGVVDSIEMADGSPAYQLQRFTATARLIRRTVQRRLGPRSRRHQSTYDFRARSSTNPLEALPPDDDRPRERGACAY